MTMWTRLASALALTLWSWAAVAATIYVETTGCNSGSTTQCSGTTDSATATISGTAAAWTTGTAVIALDTNTDISGVSGCAAGTCDGTQAIFLNNATNSTQKIFWLASYTGCTGSGSCDVTVSQNVTCSSCTGSSWGIGGRYIYPGGATAGLLSGAIRVGDVIQFNDSPASKTGAFFSAASTFTTGFAYITGKAGVRPKLTMSSGSTAIVVNSNNQGYWFENLELEHLGTGSAMTGIVSSVIKNVKMTHPSGGGTANGLAIGGTFATVLDSEITGYGGHCISAVANTNAMIMNNNLHGCGGDGINSTAAGSCAIVQRNTITGNTGRGILYSADPTSNNMRCIIAANTIASNGDSGLEVTDSSGWHYGLFITNNIFFDNGNAANEYNVETSGGVVETSGFHAYNTFYHSNCQGSGTGGPACVSGLTVNATESTADPLFVNAGSGDFALQSGSPVKSSGYPGTFVGGSTGYLAQGAVQPQAGGGSSAHIIGTPF